MKKQNTRQFCENNSNQCVNIDGIRNRAVKLTATIDERLK